MKDDLPALQKRIEELRNAICWKGMMQFCNTNIRKQQQLKELEKQLKEQISKTQPQ